MKKGRHPKPTLTPYKKAPRKKRISLTLSPTLIAALDERGPHRSNRIAADLTRYYGLLAGTRLALQGRFSTAKLSLILDACNGWTMEPETIGHLWMQVADGIRLKRLDTKWGVTDPSGLIRRLQELTCLESFAMADAIERFWESVAKGDHGREASQVLE
jgi:hypothetical protein